MTSYAKKTFTDLLSKRQANDKTPRKEALWANGWPKALRCLADRKLAALGLLEPRVVSLRLELPEYCGVHGGHNVAEIGPSRGLDQKGAA